MSGARPRLPSAVPIPEPTLLVHLSMAPLSPREVERLGPAFGRAGIRPQWRSTRDRDGACLLELRAELPRNGSTEQALAENAARVAWAAIGRYVRMVFFFPQLDGWPGGIEFGERDYRRLMRK